MGNSSPRWRRSPHLLATNDEQAARDGIVEPVVVADLDSKNYFNTVEWPDICASLQRHFARASATVDWEQREPGVTFLPDGTPFKSNQGAEQGEPLGSTKAALPLGDAVGPLRDRKSLRHACDEWFMDDAQLIYSPAVFDPWLRTFDVEMAKFGASQGEGDNIKSVARLACPATRVGDFQGWGTEYVRATCKVEQPNSATEVLGGHHRYGRGHPSCRVRAMLENPQETSSNRSA